MSAEAPETHQPQSKTELFFVFTLLALQGVGGVLAIVQHELVERRKWLTHAQFVEEWSVAQVMPGPNVVNLCLMLGGKYFGLGGAMAAVCGLILAPMAVVLCLAVLFGGVSDSAIAQGALKGMGAVSGGLFRDIMCQTEPVLLHRETIGTSCLAGAVTYLALDALDLNEVVVVAIAGFVVVLVRELSIKYNWNLPKVVKNP